VRIIYRKIRYSNLVSQFGYLFFITYPFLTLHSLSSQSAVTNLHIFHFLSHSYMFSGRLMPSSCFRFHLPLWEESKCSYELSEMYFYGFDNLGTSGVKYQNFTIKHTKHILLYLAYRKSQYLFLFSTYCTAAFNLLASEFYI
jgi:hypothetical protein